MRAPPVLHGAAGYPDPRRDTHEADGVCYWCGSPTGGNTGRRACRVQDVISDSFTDQDQALVQSSPWLCVACAWAMTGRPPDTLRLWSIAWTEAPRSWPANHPSAPNLGPHIHLQNKADPSAFRALFREPPRGRWICSIADSGQIHTLPFATVNHSTGDARDASARYAVRFERVTVHTSPAQYTVLDDSIARLLAAGFTKQDIAGEPFPARLVQCGLALWRDEQRVLSPFRGSALLDLVLFLARKDQDSERRPEAQDSDRPRANDDGERVERAHPPDRVVAAREDRPRDGRGERRQLQLDGLDDGAQAPDRRHDEGDGRAHRRARGRRGR